MKLGQCVTAVAEGLWPAVQLRGPLCFVGTVRRVIRQQHAREQIGVELLLAGVAEAVGAAGINLQRRIRHEFRRELRGCVDGYDLVVIAVNDERWHIELLQVLGEVCF